MGKHSKGIDSYKNVNRSTSGSNYYGHKAHEKSTEQFHNETGSKATMSDAQTLRDMAEARQNHAFNSSSIDTHVDDL